MADEDKQDIEQPEVKNDAMPDSPDVMTVAPAAAETPKRKFNLREFLGTKKGKITAAIVAVVLVVGVVFAVPASRYAIAGLVIKKDLTVEVIDSETGKPVSAAYVGGVANQNAKTDGSGKVTFKNVPVGEYKVDVAKSHYEAANTQTTVPILSNSPTPQVKLKATGRQVPVSVVNKISGVAVAGVEITAGDAAATTADDGKTMLVLPADDPTVEATFKVNGYNEFKSSVTVTEQEDTKNTFSMTPSGKVYFLSKRTGTINVMSSDLDGTNQKIVLTGTGKEDQYETQLITSSDWKHLALVAKRDSETAKLYHINTTDGKLSLIDEGNATFVMNGWQGDNLVYSVYRTDVKAWQNKLRSIKTFNASSKKITTIDDSEGAGTGPTGWINQVYGEPYVVNDRIVYAKYWEAHQLTSDLAPKRDQIITVKADGSERKVLREFESGNTTSFNSVRPKPQEITYRIAYTSANAEFFSYINGSLQPTSSVSDNNFYGAGYPIYRISPDQKKTFWSEMRDVNTFIVGDADGAGGDELPIKGENVTTYGWYGNDYVLIKKSQSEMYITSANTQHKLAPVKVTDFYGTPFNYGYNGL